MDFFQQIQRSLLTKLGNQKKIQVGRAIRCQKIRNPDTHARCLRQIAPPQGQTGIPLHIVPVDTEHHRVIPGTYPKIPCILEIPSYRITMLRHIRHQPALACRPAQQPAIRQHHISLARLPEPLFQLLLGQRHKIHLYLVELLIFLCQISHVFRRQRRIDRNLPQQLPAAVPVTARS